MLVTACLAIVILASSSARQDDEAAYRAAYKRWCTAVESYPQVSISSIWYSGEVGPAPLREAVNNLIKYGPDLLPFLVEELRQETDQAREYRLIGLLKRVAGIDLFFGSGLDERRGVPVMKTQFLAAWDAGHYANAATLLRSTWTEPALDADGSVDPQTLAPLMRYGVFAVPFIAEQLEQRDSSALFAAFLNVTYQMDLYRKFYKHPSNSFATPREKGAFIKQWARQNGNKFAKLKGLHDQIAAIAAK